MRSKKRKLQENSIVFTVEEKNDTKKSRPIKKPQRRSRRLERSDISQETDLTDQLTNSPVTNPKEEVISRKRGRKKLKKSLEVTEKQFGNLPNGDSKELVDVQLNNRPPRNSKKVVNQQTTNKDLISKSGTSVLKKRAVKHHKTDMNTKKCDKVKTEPSPSSVEVIELENKEVLYTALKFAIVNFENVESHSVELFEVTWAKAEVVEVEPLNEAKLLIPNIRFHLDDAFVDLTEDSDDDDQALVVASEKECANRILETVYSYHKAYLFNEQIKMTLKKLSVTSCLPSEQDVSDFTLQFKLKQITPLGQTLIKVLSKVVIRNLNLARFLQIISTKLKVKYDVEIQTKSISWYLHQMLNTKRGLCNAGLLRELLQLLDGEVLQFQCSETSSESQEKEAL